MGDLRLVLEACYKSRYYADQSEEKATSLRISGSILQAIFSLEAFVGALITIYPPVLESFSGDCCRRDLNIPCLLDAFHHHSKHTKAVICETRHHGIPTGDIV
jgi:hypothetical protein